jgi:hypothetical protein
VPPVPDGMAVSSVSINISPDIDDHRPAGYRLGVADGDQPVGAPVSVGGLFTSDWPRGPSRAAARLGRCG